MNGDDQKLMALLDRQARELINDVLPVEPDEEVREDTEIEEPFEAALDDIDGDLETGLDDLERDPDDVLRGDG